MRLDALQLLWKHGHDLRGERHSLGVFPVVLDLPYVVVVLPLQEPLNAFFERS